MRYQRKEMGLFLWLDYIISLRFPLYSLDLCVKGLLYSLYKVGMVLT